MTIFVPGDWREGYFSVRGLAGGLFLVPGDWWDDTFTAWGPRQEDFCAGGLAGGLLSMLGDWRGGYG